MNLASLAKLRALLTSDNMAYLDRLLAGLTDPSTPGYHDFWSWFKSGYREPEAYARAYRAIRQLLEALRTA